MGWSLLATASTLGSPEFMSFLLLLGLQCKLSVKVERERRKEEEVEEEKMDKDKICDLRKRALCIC